MRSYVLTLDLSYIVEIEKKWSKYNICLNLY